MGDRDRDTGREEGRDTSSKKEDDNKQDAGNEKAEVTEERKDISDGDRAADGMSDAAARPESETAVTPQNGSSEEAKDSRDGISEQPDD